MLGVRIQILPDTTLRQTIALDRMACTLGNVISSDTVPNIAWFQNWYQPCGSRIKVCFAANT